MSKYLQVFKKIALQGGITGTIRTLPLFQYSDIHLLRGEECEIKIKESPQLDAYPIIEKEGDTFYDGRYKFIGFTHVITSKEAYSEFTVIKNPKEKDVVDTDSTFELDARATGVVGPPRTVSIGP